MFPNPPHDSDLHFGLHLMSVAVPVMASLPDPFRLTLTLIAAAVLPAAVYAQALLPPARISFDELADFRPVTANWRLASGIAGNPRQEKILDAVAGKGVLVNLPTPEARGHLVTAWEHGDLDVDLEFLLPVGSNSGVYLQGRYEVQLLDSWGVREPTSGDCGGIYHRWDASRGPGKEGFEGHAPRANACRAPGLWQQLHIEFEAPRFDAAGKKTKNARFARVVLNGFVIHENVEVQGPTRSAMGSGEVARGPLMIQGDHGAIALRSLAVKRFGGGAITTDNLHYKLYAGDFKKIGDYDGKTPKSEGVPERFSHAAVEKNGRFALVFTGSVVVPRDGVYGFALDGSGATALSVDGQGVVVPLDRGSQPGTIRLAAGAHPFRVDLLHASNGRPSLEVMAEGPGIAAQALTVRSPQGNRGGSGNAKPLLVEVKDRVVVQRGFVPFEPRKRLYAASVGTPSGVHYAYDFETGSLLRVWRGPFIDTHEMWDDRGNNQLAKPAGAVLPLNGKPTLVLLESANGDWPTEPEPLWSSQGYTLEPDGLPVFLSTLAEISVRDRMAPTLDGRGLARTLQCSGKLPSWSAWVLLAEAATISRQPDGTGWIVGDREWYLDWPAGAAQRPVVRTRQGRQQLAVSLTAATLDAPLNYSIVW